MLPRSQQRSPNPREPEHPLDGADRVLDLGPRPRHTLAVASEGSVTLHDLAVHEVGGTYTLPGTVIGMSLTAGPEHAALVSDDRALLWQVGASPPPAGDR